MEELIEKLNALLATLQVQRANLQAVHWNLRGCYGFLTFHNYFGELYDQNTAHIDKIAEFIRIHGSYPMFTFAQYVHNSQVEDCSFQETNEIEYVLTKAVTDTRTVSTLLQVIFAATGNMSDVQDYIASMIDDYGKRQWFLQSSMPEDMRSVREEEGKGTIGGNVYAQEDDA